MYYIISINKQTKKKGKEKGKKGKEKGKTGENLFVLFDSANNIHVFMLGN
jgi:hypothetical protein